MGNSESYSLLLITTLIVIGICTYLKFVYLKYLIVTYCKDISEFTNE